MQAALQLNEELRFWMVSLHSGLVLMKDVRLQADALAQDVSREAGN